MAIALRRGALALLACLSGACGDDDNTGADGGSSTTGNDNNNGGTTTGNDNNNGGTSNGTNGDEDCQLRDDMYGPGQYSSSCVKREWIEEYAGTYESTTCTLTVELPSDIPARLKLVVRGATLPGDYACDWEGGDGTVNDSYYRFTTDATYATTKNINFTAAMRTTDGEMNIRLRVNDLDTAAPSYTGGFTKVVAGVNTDVDCGALTKM